MTAYRYTAVDASGARHKGTIEADSPRAARGRLREQRLLPVELAAETSGPTRAGLWRRSAPASIWTRSRGTWGRAGPPSMRQARANRPRARCFPGKGLRSKP